MILTFFAECGGCSGLFLVIVLFASSGVVLLDASHKECVAKRVKRSIQ